jgi:hypothetical protein
MLLWHVEACEAPGDPPAGEVKDTPAEPDVPDDVAPIDTGEPAPEPPAACAAWGEPMQSGEVSDALYEISAIVASAKNPGVLWVLQDAGTAPALYALDVAGNPLGTLTLDGVENIDWEALALGPCDEGSCLWVGDTGNNRQDRDEVRLLRVPEPEVPLAGGLAAHATPSVFPLVYDEGAVDAEALALTPDGVPVIVSKRYDWTAGVYLVDEPTAGVLATPRRVGTISTVREAETEVDGAVTAADIWPDGSRLLVRTYGRVWEYDLGATGVEAVDTASRKELPFPVWDNTEGVAYDAEARGYWQIEEWGHAPIWFVPCAD